MKYFNIQMAAHISGLSTHTIRAWEKRYGALSPDRSDTGRRQYTTEDIERLTLLSQLTNLGNSIGQIANLPDAELKTIYDKLTQSKRTVTLSMELSPKRTRINTEQTLNNLLLALTGYKVDIISHELNKAKVSLSPGNFALEVLSPLLTEVKIRQQLGRLSMAQVHALYAIIKFHAGNIIYSHYEKKIRSQHSFSIATPSGELHVFEIMISALLCCEHEQNFFYMSSNLPAMSVAEGVNAIGSTGIILGINQPDRLSVPLHSYLEDLMKNLKSPTPIWLVGENSHRYTTGLPKNVSAFPTYLELNRTLENLNNSVP
jgi:DNA-binding transcriptional MerR regulator